MKQQQKRSPQVGEPRNGKNEQKKRFLIVKLEERIAPKKQKYTGCACTEGCSGFQG